ncbi:MAG: S8 family serine peptidase [Candidatus Zhuqueibacterota bacterium]
MIVNFIFAQNLKVGRMDSFQIKNVTSIESNTDRSILPPALKKLVDTFQQNQDYRTYADRANIKVQGDKVVVTLMPKAGKTTEVFDGQDFGQVQAVVQARARHSMRVLVPIARLENFAEKLARIGMVKEQVKPVPDAIQSEGIALMNADTWQAEGYQGAGVKVAIIDGGFEKLTDAQSNGDIPATYTSQDFSGSGLQTDTEHGTAVAEAVYDIVPHAQFYLYKIDDLTDLENAKDACIANGVQIVNHSMSWFLQSYYDGTGPACDIVAEAIASGITWVNSSGNHAEDHYRAVFTPTVDNYHDFTGAGGKINAFGPEPGYVWLLPRFYYFQIWMNWDDYPTTSQDYDLYLYKWNSSSSTWEVAASSKTRQTGEQEPTESLYHVNLEVDGRYAIAVHKYSATVNVDFTIFAALGLSYHVVESSVTDPGSLAEVVTVGAIARDSYEAGPQEYFSGQGPTTNGTLKPDVSAPDSCNSFAFGYWQGTSLSSPYTAGVCALIQSRFPAYTSDDVKNYLYSSCTVDLGPAGRDNIYGWGKVVVPDFGGISDLRASVVSDDVLLEWTESDGIPTYNVYRGTTFDFVPDVAAGTNRIAANITDEDAGTAGIQWTDTGNGADVVGDVATNYFYRVTAVSAREYAPSSVAGEFDYQLVTTSGTDINRIVVIMNTADTRRSITTAENLAQAIPYCSDVYWWDASGQGTVGHVKGLPFNNFAVQPGYAYSVSVTKDTVWTVAGSYDNVSFNLVTTSGTDINRIGVPLAKAVLTTADQLGVNIPNCTDVYLWDAAGQGTLGHVVGLPFNNFAVRAGYPYSISITAPTTWPDYGEGELLASAPQVQGAGFRPDKSLAGGNIPHTVFGQIQHPDVEKLTLRAWISSRPGQVLTTGHVGVGIDKNYWYVGVSNFAENWNIGDSLIVTLTNEENGLYGSAVVVLSSDGSDDAGSIQLTGATRVAGVNLSALPKEFNLLQNYPNPFNPETKISYGLPQAAFVTVQIYDISGRLVRTLADENQGAGYHQVTWNGQDNFGRLVSSGVYFCKMKSGNFQKSMKLILSK